MSNRNSLTLVLWGLATLPMLIAEAENGNDEQLLCPNKYPLDSVHRHGFFAGFVTVIFSPTTKLG